MSCDEAKESTPSLSWRIALSSTAFQTGDLVYDRVSGSRGRLRNIIQDELSPTNKKKKTNTDTLWMVDTGESGKQTAVQSRKLVPIYRTNDNETTIVVTETTDTYRSLAMSQVPDRSNVLEIGSSTGCCSEVFWKKTLVHWIGFDTGSDMVQTVNRKLKQLKRSHQQQGPSNKRGNKNLCLQMDPLKDPETAASRVKDHLGVDDTKRDLCFSIFMDIGGNRERGAVLRMLKWVLHSFHGRVDQIIIKSESVHESLLQDDALSMVPYTGIVQDASSWYKQELKIALRESFPKHPLQAAKRFCPNTNVNICRYYNYHKKGCAKGDRCPFDHTVCHLCTKQGHIARVCPLVSPTT